MSNLLLSTSQKCAISNKLLQQKNGQQTFGIRDWL